MEAGSAISIAGPAVADGWYKKFIDTGASFSEAAFDLRKATQKSGNAIWLQDGHRIAMDTAGSNTISFDGTRTAFSGPINVTGPILAANLPGSTSFANDGAAAAGGVVIGQFYRNGSVVQVRVT